MKHVFRNVVRSHLPEQIADRKDKMGFPVPLNDWMRGEARDFVKDVLSSRRALEREYIDNARVLAGLDGEPRFARKIWGLLCLELWQQEFQDQGARYRALLHH